MDGGRGHPHDAAHELFASASTVLKYFADTAKIMREYPDDFFSRLEALKKSDPEAAADALEVARIVAEAYLPLKPFAFSVYVKLGIFTEMKEPPK